MKVSSNLNSDFLSLDATNKMISSCYAQGKREAVVVVKYVHASSTPPLLGSTLPAHSYRHPSPPLLPCRISSYIISYFWKDSNDHVNLRYAGMTTGGDGMKESGNKGEGEC